MGLWTKKYHRSVSNVAMVCVAAIVLGSSTYAWLVSNNAVTATGVDLSATSSVPNLYITSSGKTTDAATAAGTNPTKLYPTSTKDATNFFETKHWRSGTGKNAVTGNLGFVGVQVTTGNSEP